MVKVSVIIPCYNQGEYIDDAVDSVLAQTFHNFEIIVVNDGSTDDFTNEMLKNYNKPKTKVIKTTNQGLSVARNIGISASCGDYILPLDADDKIGSTYIEKAVKILDENKNIGILYCEAEFFGEWSGKWELPIYNFFEFLCENQIFCSAFFRRDDYNKTNGYNSNMIYGMEDWDFWLSLIERGAGVLRIPEMLFYYRIKNNSMVQTIDPKKKKYLQKIIVHNHPILYADNFFNLIQLFHENKEIKNKLVLLTQEIENIKKSRTFRLYRVIAKPINYFRYKCRALLRNLKYNAFCVII